ncbi:ankyrin repeat domain-containing protein [Candidatus Bathyarchaeota archaeon]|nr:ankyrin repeat domain-containing protein [Candidatus Bathyarchaeota archaeon]
MDVLVSLGVETAPVMGRSGLYFTNEVVSRLMECFKESGLGSAQDGYSIIIPALRCRSMLPLPVHALLALYIESENYRKAGEFHEAEKTLLAVWDTARQLSYGPDVLDSVILELGELYRHALFEKDGSQAEFGRSGISWMRQQIETLLPSTATIAARYSDLGKKAPGQARVEPSAQDVITAVSAGNRLETLWLVSQVEEVLAVDEERRTLLSWASEQGWPEIVKVALTIGSAIDSGDHSQRTPISYAAQNGHAEVLEILLKNGALPMIQDSSGRTPLSYAASGGCARVTEILLSDRRVTVLIGDEDRRLPLH